MWLGRQNPKNRRIQASIKRQVDGLNWTRLINCGQFREGGEFFYVDPQLYYQILTYPIRSLLILSDSHPIRIQPRLVRLAITCLAREIKPSISS